MANYAATPLPVNMSTVIIGVTQTRYAMPIRNHVIAKIVGGDMTGTVPKEERPVTGQIWPR